jgi:hypothetical protein
VSYYFAVRSQEATQSIGHLSSASLDYYEVGKISLRYLR